MSQTAELSLPLLQRARSESPQALEHDGSFFDQMEAVGPIPNTAEDKPLHTDLSRNESYAKYMRMHKVLVGNRGALQLETIYDNLKSETMPHYLSAAGWAAVEAALMGTDNTSAERHSLFENGVGLWRQALDKIIEGEQAGQPYEPSYGHRVALDIAVTPLLAGILQGDVTQVACERAFEDCLAVAKSNAAYLRAAKTAGNIEVMAAHVGLGYECNALLAFNRRLSRTWFVVPTMARCDSGYYYRGQTHDLLVIHQKYGVIHSATPVEIKSRASLRDRRRYNALLVRGKMHLSVEGKEKPEHTLGAISAVHEGTATEESYRVADNASNRFTAMVRDYYAGELLGKVAGRHSVTLFRDSAQVIAHHPGLSKSPMAS